ncbi:MAG: hypothetical protein J6T85_01550 [Paludibacteraceae bacterium]|nr:hypothetical protein [Paludibacteraceae bacterium]
MVLTLIRTNFSPAETTGILLVSGKPFCGTLEPPVVPNAQHTKGAIPLGWYKVTVVQSRKFGRVLPLLHSQSMERALVEALSHHPDETHYIDITDPERYYVEHNPTKVV